YRKFDNYLSGDGKEISSAYETYGINSGLGLNISKKQRVFVNYIYSEAKDVMHAGLPMDAKYDKSNMVSLDYEFNEINELISSFKIKLFAANEDHLMTNEYRPNAVISLANTTVYSNDFGGRFIFEIKPIKNGLMNFGSDFKHIAKEGNKEVSQYKNPCTTPPTIFNPPKEKVFEVWQNTNSQDFGAFIDFKYYFSQKLNVKAGLRTDFMKNDIKEPEQDFINLYDGNIKPANILNFNYFANVKYNLAKSFYVEFSVGHGTRNPSLTEHFINHFTIGLDAYEYIGNPHLKSESNNQINLMLSKTHKNFYTYIDLFYSQINNYITAVVDTTIPRKFIPCKEPKFSKQFTNIENAQQYGINFGAKIYFLKHFSANLDLNYVYAENLDLNDPLPETAPFTSLFTLAYKNNNLHVNLVNEYQAKQTRVSSLVGEQASEEFTVFNISSSYLFFEKLNIGLAIDNIFDANYYRHLSRPYKNMDTTSMFYEPGRKFRLFLKYVF
ncbi:MAG: TonB-dependent receptor, partial [Draconibacterium sp.]|nr:TonB-dependent receptor [Draconibacterium sp.]